MEASDGQDFRTRLVLTDLRLTGGIFQVVYSWVISARASWPAHGSLAAIGRSTSGWANKHVFKNCQPDDNVFV